MSKARVLSFDVLGVPVPAPRPSVGRKGVYMDRRSEHWKSQVRDSADDAMRISGWKSPSGPVAIRVEVEFVMVRRGKAADGPLAHAIRPDLDNLMKLVMDAMTLAKVYRDDGCVSSIVAWKRWQRPGERFAGVNVSVSMASGARDDRPTLGEEE